ncbi:MAG: hypothetical protein IT381_29115 [Deltaproteobacteria bacterium]|nr:hypothetical protein [Deltaproteobacteria bacterium]
MNARYQLLQYMPHALLADAITIGALVRADSGTELVLPKKIRKLAGVGGENADQTVASAVERLIEAGASGATPNKLGPYFHLSEEREAPHQQLQATVEWLRRLLASAFKRSSERGPQSATRLTSARKHFLEPNALAGVVKKKFKPSGEWRDTKLAHYSSLLKPVSQWVGAGARVMLLEPLDVDLVTFDGELEKVGTEMMAYENAVHRAKVAKGPELITYLLGDGKSGRKKAAERLLKDFSEVLDVARPAHEKELVARIQRTAHATESTAHH